MWSLKFLSGPKAGKEIVLQPGLLFVGRDASCQICVPAQGLSKKHAQILVRDKELVIEDLNSRNGVFMKGKKIKKQRLIKGDRVILSDIVIEVRKKSATQTPAIYQSPVLNPTPDLKASHPDTTKQAFGQKAQKLAQDYMHDVVLPGVYKLAEWLEFKMVVAGFMLAFVVVVTALSSFPLISILKTSVEEESRNSAENIAITLAMSNRASLKKGLESGVTVDYALRRPGVKKAFIISSIDGRVLAPAEIAHTYPKNSLIHKARKLNQITVEKSGTSNILAMAPISFYNPNTGENLPKAYSVVIYDMSSLAVGTKKVAGLLAQTVLITGLVGFVLFFFLIHLIEFPLRSLNKQLGQALKDEKSPSITLNYQSQVLTELCSHINSALNQISLNQMLSAKNEDDTGEVNRQSEMDNLVEIIGFPALSVNIEEETVAAANSSWTDQIGFGDILGQPMANINDSELRDHLLTLIEQGKNNPQEMAFGEIQLNQIKLQSSCQIVMGKKSPAYAIIAFIPPSAEEGAA